MINSLVITKFIHMATKIINLVQYQWHEVPNSANTKGGKNEIMWKIKTKQEQEGNK